MKKEFLRSLIIMLITVVVFGLAACGLNFLTGPIIEQNNAGAANELLENVMPGGKFEELYVDGGASTLADVPAEITVSGSFGSGTTGKFISFHKETSGLGFVFRFQMTTQFSKEPIIYTVGVNAEGQIVGINQDQYTDSKAVTDAFNSSFIGNDSALGSVELVGGVTYSSLAIKTGVELGMKVLSDNGLITAGQKDASQIYAELMGQAHTGLASTDELVLANKPASITKGYKAKTGSGYAYIMVKGEETLLAIVNNSVSAVIYSYTETDGVYALTDVTANHTDLVADAVNYTNTIKVDYATSGINTFASLMGIDSTAITVLEYTVYNSTVLVVSFEVEGNVYYGFANCTSTFNGETATNYIVIDHNGAIAKIKPQNLIISEDDFIHYGNWDPNLLTNTLNGLIGTTADAFDADNKLMTGATFSSKALSTAIADAFATYNVIKNGGTN